MTYRADIDGLRTVAVLLVLVFHFDLFTLGKAGFIGVDVFFVISGFLIMAIIRKDLETGHFNFGEFLYRRIRRLYPALLATLLLTLVAGWLLFLPFRFVELAKETMFSLLYVVNFYYWQNINYFGLRADGVPLLHMWSLAVEEQFYVFFPLACWIIWRWAPRLLLPAVILALLLSFGLGLFFTPRKPELAFYLLPTRAWELMIGAVLALVTHGRVVRGAWLQVMGPLGLCLIAASVVVYGPLTQVPGWFAVLPTLGTVAVILGGFAEKAPATRMLATPPMVWIGKISYPLYLVHWPIRIFLQEHLVEFTFPWRLFGFVLSFAVAAGIYYLIEVPVRRRRVLSKRGHYVGLVASMSVVMIAASGLIQQRGGVPERFAPEVAEILAFRDDSPTLRRHCTKRAALDDATCALGDKSAPREVLVIGDSHARALSGAMDLWLEEQGRGGTLLFNPGCMPVAGAGQGHCRSNIDTALKLAEWSPDFTEVVLISIWRQGLPKGGKPFDGRWVPEAEVEEVFATRLAQTVDRLRTAGKQVTIVEPFFAATGDVPVTLAGNIAFNRDRPVDRSLADHMATFTSVHAAMDNVLGQNVRSLSVIDPFCENGICRAVVDGRPLFTDNNHVAMRHSPTIAAYLQEQTTFE
ncbi:MAG: acyltransferase family protein [Tateyamaria sp.]|uniref:acyltransferase family protein n=1 Tax=Tateyamaria sp. TaxID=1929288 RepID=UPI003283ED46